MQGPSTERAFLREIETSVDPTLNTHVVLDHLSARKAPPVQRWLLRHPRVQFHFTPTDASWLSLVDTADEILDSMRRFSLRAQQVHW